MKDIEIKISRETRKIIEISKLVIGNDGENLQGNLMFSFSDEFVKGQARLEYVLDDVEDTKNKKYQLLTQENETYKIPIKSVLTKQGKLFMQLVITEGTDEEEIPVFKSNVFYVKINNSINAEIEQPNEYSTWIEIANTKLNQIDNLDISAIKVDNVATITVTDKNGNKNSVEIYDGEQGPQGIQGPQGVQGPKPVKGVDYYTEEEKSEFVESITNDANSKFNQNVNEKATTFNDNASSKLEKFNDNVTSKTNSFNENVTTKTEEFNTNATSKTTTYNDNATSKLNEFNDNAISKVQEYNDNVDNLLGNVDAICPKNEVSGEYITIDDAMQYKVFETKIDGNSYQETTTGKNKLDFETLFENADFVTKNGDNYSFVGDSSSHFLKKDYELEVGTWILSFDYTSNNIVISASGNLIALNAYHEDGSSEWIKVVTDTTVNNSRITVPFTITEKITSLQLQQFNRFTSGTITISNIQIGVDNIYEKYTGAVPSPNPDYQQEIEVIEDNIELIIQNENLYDYKDTTTITPGAYSIDDDGWITCSYDNSSGTGIKYLNYFTHNLNLKPSTSYKVILEVAEYSGNGGIYVVSSYNNESQFKNNLLIQFENFATKKIKIMTGTTLDDLQYSTKGLRTFVQIAAGESASITFRISVLEDLTITEDIFVYKSHKSSKYNINLQDNFIGKIGNIKDELVIDKKGNVSLIKRIDKVVLDGTVYWARQDDNMFYSTVIKNLAKSNSKLLATRFKYSSVLWEFSNKIGLSTSGNLWITIDKGITNSEDFRIWLTENNVTVYYELAEPQIIDLGTLDTPIETFEGINNIFAITNLDTKINVKYALDIKKYTDKKVEELTNALISTSANV